MSKQCQVEECTKPAYCKGYCNPHYQRLRRTGSPTRGGYAQPRPGFLTVSQAAQRLDVTREAIHQALNRGSLEARMVNNRYEISEESLDNFQGSAKRPSNLKVCKWEAEPCERRARSLDLCSKHYQRAMYEVEHEYLIPENKRKPRCFVEECGNPQYAKGLCRKHDVQERAGLSDPFNIGLEAPAEPSTFGGRVKMFRIRQGFTLRDLAERAGVTHQRIAQLEKLSSSPSPRVVYRIAQALGISTDQLQPPETSNGNGAAVVAVTTCPYCSGRFRPASVFEVSKEATM